MGNDSTWQLYQEPLRTTLRRTGALALIVGAVMARWFGGLAHWPAAVLLAFWISFGGHWVEVWFLYWLRPRLPAVRAIQIAARLAVWFIGGVGLAYGMRLTAMALALYHPARWPAWWFGGFAFIGIELVVHLVIRMRR